ncbi:ComF family protein [uncultured Roseovarius sp.]|uniref:ComF family protein n=1 Tax=uncultured Roseovarius sp. TaxID=293344 RepID=UPI00259901C1|nr:ComF family protein [uncultured Roseovarius sp.]
MSWVKDSGVYTAFQTALRLVYPPRCTLCGTQVESEFGLCGPCWRDTPFISDLCCDACGVPLPGDDAGTPEFCDDCLTIARPWSKGRAALIYRDNGRNLVLALKHGDRHDIVRPAALWMTNAARPLVDDQMIVAPVPLHWTRIIRRRFNQSALLARGVARKLDLSWCPDLLVRPKRTRPLDGLGRDARFETLQGMIEPHRRRRQHMVGRSVLLVDDVMTSGATLSAAAQACFRGGAADVRVVTLARAAKDA